MVTITDVCRRRTCRASGLPPGASAFLPPLPLHQSRAAPGGPFLDLPPIEQSAPPDLYHAWNLTRPGHALEGASRERQGPRGLLDRQQEGQHGGRRVLLVGRDQSDSLGGHAGTSWSDSTGG